MSSECEARRGNPVIKIKKLEIQKMRYGFNNMFLKNTRKSSGALSA
jgi:hypothetical protein